jgi:hypothetical protein
LQLPFAGAITAGGTRLGPEVGLPLYEIVLRYADHEEVRLTDDPPAVGEEVEIAGRVWVVGEPELVRDLHAEARYVCTEARDKSAQLRARSQGLRIRSGDLRRSKELRDRRQQA